MWDEHLVDQAAKINPQTIIDRVLADGWIEAQSHRAGVRIFQITKPTLYQVNVPLKTEFSDYASALYRCATELATYENKSVPRLILELRRAEIIEKLSGLEKGNDCAEKAFEALISYL
jgi:tRNA isopentenyl-2-thiomethyl-A-37 hydroxylase MiaE